MLNKFLQGTRRVLFRRSGSSLCMRTKKERIFFNALFDPLVNMMGEPPPKSLTFKIENKLEEVK